MNKGISNFQIEKFFKEENNEERKKNYMGTFSLDSVTKYIDFYSIIKNRNAKYRFAIFKTAKENEPGKHWWSFLDIQPKNNLFLFDSLGLDGFKIFVVNNQETVINELLYNFKRCELQYNNKLTLSSIKFCVNTWLKMSQKTKSQLTETAQNLFHLLEQSAKLKQSQCMNILILENRVQNLLTSDCGPFQLHFYKNLFNPDEQSKILHHQKLTKNTLETLLNEIFLTGVKENRYLIKNFEEKHHW